MIIGYADSETPPNYDGITTYYDNMRWYCDLLIHRVTLKDMYLIMTD